MGGVTAGRLAELGGGGGDVEQVVDDLEGQPDLVAEADQGSELIVGGPGAEARASVECGWRKTVPQL